MAPAVAQLSSDLSRLKAEADSLQSQNDAFAGRLLYKDPQAIDATDLYQVYDFHPSPLMVR